MTDGPHSPPEDRQPGPEERDHLTSLVVDLADHVLDDAALYELLEKREEERREMADHEVGPSEHGGSIRQ